MEYRYGHYERRRVLDELGYHAGPKPGEPFPDFDLPTTDGRRLRKQDFVGSRPLLLVFGSSTCPATAASEPILAELRRSFGDKVAFATVYVREAHPGERYPQPRSFQQKMTHAVDYKERRAIPWTVAVDSLQGALHRSLDYKANGVWLMDVDGNVAFRGLSAVDRRGLVMALRRLATGGSLAKERRARPTVALSALGMLWPVVHHAGRSAERDMVRAAAPIWWTARLAASLERLPPLGRGLAAVGLVAAGLAGGALLTRRAVRAVRSGRTRARLTDAERILRRLRA